MSQSESRYIDESGESARVRDIQVIKVVVCCSVLQYVAVCCSDLPCVGSQCLGEGDESALVRVYQTYETLSSCSYTHVCILLEARERGGGRQTSHTS